MRTRTRLADSITVRLGSSICFVILLIGAVAWVNRPASAACNSAPQDKGTITASAAVPSTGTYYIWSRNKTATASNNGYYLKIDSNCTITVGDANLPVNSWTWINYQDGNTNSRMSVNLTAGTHSFSFYGLDPSVQVDRLVLSADANCTPTGTGDNCTNGNSTPPIVVTTPGTTGPTTTGTVQVGSSNSDAKTTVKVDGKVITSGNGLVNVDTSNLSDGFHDLTIQITNPDGTVQTVTKRILVQNNLPFWKKPYVWLYAKTHYNKTLTNLITFVVSTLLLAALGIGIFIAWSRRVWEKLPGIKNIHLGFLHVPSFLRNLFSKSPAPATGAASTALVGDMHSKGSGTINPNPIKFTLLGHTFSPNIPAIATIAAFAFIGSAALLYGSAAANGFVVEPESGNKTIVTTITDSSASGNSYIQFGTGQCPAGQTGTPPNCTTPPATCPAGQTGTPPNCVTPPPATGNIGPANCQLTQADEGCWAGTTGVKNDFTSDPNDRWTQSQIVNDTLVSGHRPSEQLGGWLNGCQQITSAMTAGATASNPYVYKNKKIRGYLSIQASYVKVENVYVEYTDSGWCPQGVPGNGAGCCSAIMTGNDDNQSNATKIRNIQIVDTEVESGVYGVNSGIVGSGMNIQRVNAHGGFIILGYNNRSYIQDSYIHDVTRDDECVYSLANGQSCTGHSGRRYTQGTGDGYLHKDTLWEQGISDLAIVHSYMKHSSWTNPIGGSSGGCLCDNNTRNILISNSLLYGGSGTGIIVLDAPSAGWHPTKMVWDRMRVGGGGGPFLGSPPSMTDYSAGAWTPVWDNTSPGPGAPGIPVIDRSRCTGLMNLSGGSISCS